MFEKIDSVAENWDNSDLDIFVWQEHAPKPKQQSKKAVSKQSTAPKAPPRADAALTHPLLDMVAEKYWQNYSDWVRLILAIKSEFFNYKGMAIYYYNVEGYRTEDGLGDVVLEKLEQCQYTGTTMGTFHHYAKLSDPRRLLLPHERGTQRRRHRREASRVIHMPFW